MSEVERCEAKNPTGERCIRVLGHRGGHSLWPQEAAKEMWDMKSLRQLGWIRDEDLPKLDSELRKAAGLHPHFCEAAASYGESAARSLFEGRGNPSNVHLTEGELRHLLALAVEKCLSAIEGAVKKRMT